MGANREVRARAAERGGVEQSSNFDDTQRPPRHAASREKHVQNVSETSADHSSALGPGHGIAIGELDVNSPEPLLVTVMKELQHLL